MENQPSYQHFDGGILWGKLANLGEREIHLGARSKPSTMEPPGESSYSKGKVQSVVKAAYPDYMM